MRIVFTAGFFDPLHRGHIAHFREAKGLGDKLVVLIHRDECCVRKKGYVFMPLDDRLAVLRSIVYVDGFMVCGAGCDLTATAALEALRPAVFAKGGDRAPGNMPRSEIEICKKLGIEIIYGVGGGKVQSSSWLVEGARKRCG